ncbi:hypothetical protein AB0M12_40915 [Nocardia vinacea]|uniref:hypothetical protein n=1 Tax=Nocardia vinacea TaxID=96468 RepID=UPI00342A3B8E
MFTTPDPALAQPLRQLRAGLGIAVGVVEDQESTEHLIALVRDFVIYHARAHTVVRVINYELAALSPEHQREIKDIRHAIDAEVRTVIEHGAATVSFDNPNQHVPGD